MNETSAAPARSGLTAATGPSPSRGWRGRIRRAGARCPRSAAATDSRPRTSASRSVCASGPSATTAFIVSRACCSCSFDSVRRSPIAMARRGDDVGLARRRAAAQHLVELRGRAAEHQARVEGQVRFAGELAAETVEDARELVVGAIAELLPEDLRRVAGLPCDLQLPGRGAAAGRHREARVARAVLEARARTARPCAASTSAARAAACGSPASSSSPVMTTIDVHVVEQRRRPSAPSARR